MGQLVAKHYPTNLAFGLADHTYVQCGTGLKAWGCWGGKTGGAVLRDGSGSTRRANDIAQPDERANIKCYLINGVCHQAANRILLVAGITVRGAKGYDYSEVMFGPYGRPRGVAGFCVSPFDQYPGTTGDLPECTAPAVHAGIAPERGYRVSGRERDYLKQALALYDRAGDVRGMRAMDSREDLIGFSVELLHLKVDFHLGGAIDNGARRNLDDLRARTEADRLKIEEEFGAGSLSATAFGEAIEETFTRFQLDAADVLSPAIYKPIFGQEPGDVVRLVDPEILARSYPDKR